MDAQTKKFETLRKFRKVTFPPLTRFSPKIFFIIENKKEAEMITLHKNMDTKQPAQFSSIESMKKAIIKNPFMYDGLALFENKDDEDCLVNLRYIELDGKKFWEVEEFPEYASSSYTIEQAVEVFAQTLSELGVY
jgi:hypothetical protein